MDSRPTSHPSARLRSGVRSGPRLLRLWAFVISFWLASLPATAQDLPDWTATSINDFAALLTNDDARIIDQALIALHDETGVEGTVVTLTDRARYGGTDGLEPFATRLFNDWGVGDAARNDGFMLLVLRDDREMRIVLGQAYGRSVHPVAEAITARRLVPAFRAGDLSGGIREGTLAIINDIARPRAAGMGYEGPTDKPDPLGRIVPFLVVGFFGFTALQIGRGIWRRVRFGRRPCPNCGGTGLVQESEVIQPSDGEGRASQVIWSRCRHCDWTGPRSDPMPLTRRSGGLGRGGGGFGGGRSSGGGASGRW